MTVEPEAPPADRDDATTDVSGDREIDALCSQVAESGDRADEFPAWLLRRCREMIESPSDSPERP